MEELAHCPNHRTHQTGCVRCFRAEETRKSRIERERVLAEREGAVFGHEPIEHMHDDIITERDQPFVPIAHAEPDKIPVPKPTEPKPPRPYVLSSLVEKPLLKKKPKPREHPPAGVITKGTKQPPSPPPPPQVVAEPPPPPKGSGGRTSALKMPSGGFREHWYCTCREPDSDGLQCRCCGRRIFPGV